MPHCDVLLCAYGGGHVAMLAPVAKRLAEEGADVRFLALTTAQAYLAARQIPYFGYADLEESTGPRARDLGVRLAGSLPPGPVPKEESIAYLGLNYLALVERFGETRAADLYDRLGRHAFLPVSILKRLLGRLQPKLVITTNSPRSEQAMMLAARELGIARMTVVDTFGFHALEWLKEPGFADKICVINDKVRQHFIASGCDDQQVVATGNPAFDEINAPATIQAGHDWRAMAGIPAHRKIILWASQPEPEKHPFNGKPGRPCLPREIEAGLRQAVRQHEDWHLVVRYHPSENIQFQPEDRVSLSPASDLLHPLVHAADAVIVMTSTVGLEAFIANKQVITVDQSVISPDVPYAEFGMASSVRHLSALEPALKQALARLPRNDKVEPTPPATRQVCAIAQTFIQ